MRKFKLIAVVLLAALFTGTVSPPIPAQMAVLDVFSLASFTQMINQVYATYDHIMATIEQVQNTYEQLKKQAEMVMSMPEKYEQFKNNTGSIDLTSKEGFEKFRYQYSDTIAYLNSQMDLLNNIYDTFTKKKIMFGGKAYTFGGLIGMAGSDPGTNIFDLPRNIVEYMSESAKEGMAGYAGKLTREQQTALMQKYGLSPRNYYKVKLVEQTAAVTIDSLLADALKDADELRARAHMEQVQYIEDLKKIAGDSLVSQMEVNTDALLRLKDDIQQVTSTLKKTAALHAQQQLQKETLEEAMAEQRLKEAENKKKEDDFNSSAILMGNW